MSDKPEPKDVTLVRRLLKPLQDFFGIIMESDLEAHASFKIGDFEIRLDRPGKKQEGKD